VTRNVAYDSSLWKYLRQFAGSCAEKGVAHSRNREQMSANRRLFSGRSIVMTVFPLLLLCYPHRSVMFASNHYTYPPSPLTRTGSHEEVTDLYIYLQHSAFVFHQLPLEGLTDLYVTLESVIQKVYLFPFSHVLYLTFQTVKSFLMSLIML